MTDFKEKANLIWQVADLLRGDYKQSDYGKVILPLTVLRRLDCVLKPTKEKVLAYLPKIKDKSDNAKDLILNNIAGHNFHNRSKYDFEKLKAEPDKVAANLRNYINGFSAGAREIVEYFNFDGQIERMDDPKADILFQVVTKFANINLSDMGSMEMGYVFEELIRRFAEQSNETAGEHFTPREVIKLMVNVLFIADNETLTKEGIVKTLYDPACGTGGMLSIGEQHLNNFNKKAKLEVFGQEINPESYAICKSDMLIKGQNPANIKFGNTFTVDGLEDEKFDYMLSNPPFSLDKWGKVVDKEESKASDSFDPETDKYNRFWRGTPPKSKGDWAFISHMIETTYEGKGKVGVVVPHGVLFRGASEGKIRQKTIEENILEAVIGLPANLFFGTSIPAAIMIFNKGKGENKNVLFIDSSRYFEAVKNQNKLRQQDIEHIVDTYRKFTSGKLLQGVVEDKFSYVATPDVIKENDFNLNIPRYVDTFEEEPEVDIAAVQKEIDKLESELKTVQAKMDNYLEELGA